MRTSSLRPLGALLTTRSLVLAGLIVAAFWFVLTSMLSQWLDDPNYTHGLFVIPMAAILAWRRRALLEAVPARVDWFGLIVLMVGGGIYLVSILAAELFTSRVSLVVMVTGLVLLIQGRERTRILLFPLMFLLLMIPLPYILYYKITFPLQLESSKLTELVLNILGMPVLRSGNVIKLEHYTLEVVTACSGLRSIMTLGAMSIFVIEFLKLGLWRKVLLVSLVIPISILANTARLTTTAVMSAVASPEAADSFLHELSGILLFLIGLGCLLGIGKAMEWSNRKTT